MLKIVLVGLIWTLFVDDFRAQTVKQKYQIDFNVIKGELTSKDPTKKDFGRYDGYEIELFEEEAINFIVYSNDFQPTIALVNSKGEIFKQSVRNDKGYANIVTIIKSGGNYLLYIIGDANAKGGYTLQTAVAEPNALYLNKEADFCSTLDFLLAHATAYFCLLENSELTKGPLIKLNDSIDSYIDEEAGSYKSTYYSNNDLIEAETTFKNIGNKVKECFGKEWQISTQGWERIEDYKEKSNTFKEKIKVNPRYVKIVIKDYTISKSTHHNNFSVEVEVNRKQ